MTVKNVAPDVYLVWSKPGNAPQTQHTEASLRELIAKLESEGWEIDEQPELDY